MAPPPLAFMLLDLDGFKGVNDTHGHGYGDTVLRAVGGAITRAIRATDVAARWGGEEFGIVSPNTSADGACELAERLRVRIKQEPLAHGPVTVSIGVDSAVPSDSVESLLNRADTALYRAKQAGRDGVVALAEDAP